MLEVRNPLQKWGERDARRGAKRPWLARKLCVPLARVDDTRYRRARSTRHADKAKQVRHRDGIRRTPRLWLNNKADFVGENSCYEAILDLTTWCSDLLNSRVPVYVDSTCLPHCVVATYENPKQR